MSYISFQPFSYIQHPKSNKTVLSLAPSISIDDEKYKKFLPLFILSIIIYIIGIPLFFIIVLIKAKKSNFNKYWSDRFGWVFLNYKSNRFWFELFEITIKFILALSAIIFLNDEKGIETRNYFLLGLFVVALMIMIYLRPYQMDLTFENNGKFAAEDKAQIGLYLMLIGAITLALGFLKNILFLILWPLGAIIGLVGLYHSYQKKLERKFQQRVKYNLKRELNKQDKQLKKFTGKQAFDDIKLLSLNQKFLRVYKKLVY